MESGRFKAGESWIVPRFLTEWKLIWFAMNGREDLVHDRCQMARDGGGNGLLSAAQLDWIFANRRAPDHPVVQFSAHAGAAYVAARRRVAEILAEHGLYWFMVWGCDLQRLYPDMGQRWDAFTEWIAFVQAFPHIIPKVANEPWNNGWSNAVDGELLRYGAHLRDQLTDGRAFAISDPEDRTDVAGEPLRSEALRTLQVGGPRSFLTWHPVRDGDVNNPRYARWLDHMNGIRQIVGAGDAVLVDEANSASNFWEQGYRESRIAALVAGQLLGAMMGGFSQMWRSEESPPVPPGWTDGKVAAVVPGSPDYRYDNAGGPHSPVQDFSGFGKPPNTWPEGKVRTMGNGQHGFAVAWGAPGALVWKAGYVPQRLGQWQDGPAVVEFWEARR